MRRNTLRRIGAVTAITAALLTAGLLAPACGDDGAPVNNNQVDADVPDAQWYRCGNGLVEPGEQCDDGNLIDNDGCSNACTFTGSCGNGTVEPPEECDETAGLVSCVLQGHLEGTVTCSASCLLESDCSDDASDLLAWYKLDEATGLVVDSTFGGNSCSVVGGVERDYPGIVGKAFLFNGQDAYADCGPGVGLAGMSALTLEAWVQLTTATREGVIVSRAASEDAFSYVLGVTGSGTQLGVAPFHVFFAVGDFSQVISSSDPLVSGVWTHIAAVYDAGQVTLYVDGVAAGTGSLPAGGPVPDPADARARLGHLNPGTATPALETFLAAFLDEVKIWAVARSQAEVCADAGGTPDGQGGCALAVQ